MPHNSDAGVLLMAYLIALVLYGFGACRAYRYLQQFPKDPIGWKSLILFPLSVDSVALAFLTSSVHMYMKAQIALTGVRFNSLAIIVVFLVQGYYAFHIWRLGKSRVMAAIVAALAAAAFALGMVATAQIASNPILTAFSEQPFKGLNSWCQGLILLAASLTFWVLSISNDRTYIARNSSNQLHEYLIARGGVATVLQLGHFLTFLLGPKKFYWVIFQMITSRMFLLSIITMLNSRASFDSNEKSETGLSGAKPGVTYGAPMCRPKTLTTYTNTPEYSGPRYLSNGHYQRTSTTLC
ncbi:hypothetical protein DFH06DRAFT_1327438 [Mycena polygramma]|nr:hypothetical protein DFH06DRAFT_1327438 [Mycena polygramma]